MSDPGTTPKGGRRGARPGASSSRPSEAAHFEREFPGASWLATRAFRELVVVGASAETYVTAVARRHGLSHIAMNVLAVIEGNGSPMPAGAVGERVHITSGSTTSVLDTLERNGLIERLPDPDDRRRVLVEVTPAAQDLLDQVLAEVSQAVSAALGGFDDDELEEFFVMLTRLREAIASAPADLGPPPARRTPSELQRVPRKG
jgi:DNA-binding MarR family transcriptional regulator